MNIIVVGAGRVGYAITEGLSREGHSVTIIDDSMERIDYTSNTLDVIAFCGNGASYEVLQQAQADRADLLIAVTSLDEINLLCCITAKKLGASHTIARVRNPEYYRQILFLKDELGLSMSVNPEQAAADEISRILRFPAAVKVEPFAKGKVELVEFRLGEKSPINGLVIKRLQAKTGAKVLVCAVERDDRVYIPKGDFTLQFGDRLSIVGSPEEVYNFFRATDALRRTVKTVMILGGSKITAYLARQLTEVGMRVTIIEQSEERCAALIKAAPKATIIMGDGTRPEVLWEENVEGMDAFVALTGDDEDNIITSMYAKSSGAGKIIAKVNEDHLIKMMSGRDLDTFIQPKLLVSQSILQYIRTMQNAHGSSVETLYYLYEGRIEALEFTVLPESRCIGIPLKDLGIRSSALVAAINRGAGCIIPVGSDVIQSGDSVIVITDKSGMRELDDILEDA